jgi:hypothetical protein
VSTLARKPAGQFEGEQFLRESGDLADGHACSDEGYHHSNREGKFRQGNPLEKQQCGDRESEVEAATLRGFEKSGVADWAPGELLRERAKFL